MQPFGWTKWQRLFNSFKQSKRRSIERWGLSYLHSKDSLDNLALSITKMLENKNKTCRVNVESIWIDGTPQAETEMLSGKKIKCELADLLFIVEETYPGDPHLHKSGLLLQGKATPNYNKLTDGKSTKKERQLLELMNRAKPLSLYKGTRSSSQKIGTYNLLDNISPRLGLDDCSRYLLMPKANKWVLPTLKKYSPFQVGWPISQHSLFLKEPENFVQSIHDMIYFKNIGKPIVNPSTCGWSKMVNDLCGNYRGVKMKGYNGQNRINRSSYMSSLILRNMSDGMMPPDQPPGGDITENKNEMQPSIPIIKVSIQYFDELANNAIKTRSIRNKE